jgi:hypothetical protein
MKRWIESMAEKDSPLAHGEVVGQVAQLEEEGVIVHTGRFLRQILHSSDWQS